MEDLTRSMLDNRGQWNPRQSNQQQNAVQWQAQQDFRRALADVTGSS